MKDISTFFYFKERFKFKLYIAYDPMDFVQNHLLRIDNNFLLKIKIDMYILTSEYKIIPNKVLNYYNE